MAEIEPAVNNGHVPVFVVRDVADDVSLVLRDDGKCMKRVTGNGAHTRAIGIRDQLLEAFFYGQKKLKEKAIEQKAPTETLLVLRPAQCAIAD